MSKTVYFRDYTATPLKVVKDNTRDPSGHGCAPCFFKHNPGGCPTTGEEYRAGAGKGCCKEGHHYVEVECAS